MCWNGKLWIWDTKTQGYAKNYVRFTHQESTVSTHTHIYTVKDIKYTPCRCIVVHTHAFKIPLLIYALMKTCMRTLRSNVHNRDGASTVRIAAVLRTHAFQGRCLQFHEGVQFFFVPWGWDDEFFFGWVKWYIKIFELRKLGLHSWLWRAFCCLAAFWPWMVWHRPSKRSCSRTACYLARHPPGVSSNKQRWGVFIVSYWILPMLSYEFGPVSHIQNLFQQLLLDFWDPMIIEEHQTTKYNQMMYINLLCLGLKRVWFKVKLLTVRNWSAVSSLLLSTDVCPRFYFWRYNLNNYVFLFHIHCDDDMRYYIYIFR